MMMPLFQKDKMTNDERMMAIMTGKPLDRIPFSLFALGFCAKNVGYSIFDFYDDQQKAYDSIKWTSEMYGATWMPFGGFAAIGPYEFGGEMQWPTNEYMQCPNAEPAVNSEEDAWNLKLHDPEELKKTGYFPRYLEFARISVSNKMPFCLPVYGTWTTAGNIVGLPNLCKWSIKKPDLAHHILRLATDFLVMFNQIIVDEFGAQNYFAVNSTASAANNIISTKLFKEFVMPYTIEYHEKIIDMGIPGILLHICGEQNKNYEFYPEIPLPPASQISVSHEVDLEIASKAYPEYALIGNIEPAMFLMGKPEDVYEASRIAIEKGKKHNGGFILAPGCELPPGATPYHIYMMAKAVNDFGYYD